MLKTGGCGWPQDQRYTVSVQDQKVKGQAHNMNSKTFSWNMYSERFLTSQGHSNVLNHRISLCYRYHSIGQILFVFYCNYNISILYCFQDITHLSEFMGLIYHA